MKKIAILGLALSLALSGCAVAKESGGEDGEKDVQAPVSNQLAIDAQKERAEYYQKLAAELEDEVLRVRTELFSDRVEYEAKIDALEEKLAAALAQKETGNGGVQTTPPESSGSSDSTDSPQTDPYADFTFTITDGKATLHTYVGNETQVVIPSTYRGCPVVAVADRAFENKTRIVSVVLPQGIETVGWFAFSGCVSLRDVTLPESVRSISYGAFLNCNSAMVIRCSAGSYAEQYAISYGIGTKK